MPTPEDYERLAILLRGAEGDQIRSYDQAVRSRESSETWVLLTSRSSRMIHVGPLLTTTDRELRRAVSILASDAYRTEESGFTRWKYEFEEGPSYFGDVEDRPRPISPNDGGLEVADATAGSLHLLLEAYGAVQSLLTSKPLQALAAMITLGQGAGTVRLWARKRKDPLEGLSAREALEVIKAFDGDTARLMQDDRPELELEIQEFAGEGELLTDRELDQARRDEIGHPTPPSPRPIADEVNQMGEIVTTGRRLTVIRNYPDGTQDIIYLDG